MSDAGERLELLVSAARIRRRVRELARQLDEDYRGRSLTLVIVLKGAIIFAADLMRWVTVPLAIEFVSASSYRDAARSSGEVMLAGAERVAITGRDVLLIEDILDTGLTCRTILDRLARERPASLALCTLLRKDIPGRTEPEAAYVGFDIPDRFVVGYGMDYAERYRNLRDIHALSFDKR